MTVNRKQTSDFKVLFLYPNQRSMSLVPSSIGVLSQLLKDKGYSAGLFDTSTYLIEGTNSDEINEENLLVKKVKEEQKVKREKTDVFGDLNRKIKQFKPDLLAVSATESTFPLAIKLLQSAEERIPTILGGVFATFASEIALKYPEVDMVCVGEGEEALIELCGRLKNKERYDDIRNIWVKKKDGGISKNPMRKPTNIDMVPPLDLTIFDEKRLYRMMAGKVYRMIPVETHRGCPFGCAYCDSPSQNRMYREQTNSVYFRTKSLDVVHKDLVHYKKKWKAEYIFFWADTFFSYTEDQIDKFAKMYKEINLPFYAQSRPETITDFKIKRLKEVGLHRLGVGIEHGNEEYRTKFLNRHYKNDQLIKSLCIVTKYDIPFSVNNMVGLPDETPELFMDTVEINRLIPPPDSASCSIFQPYHGTPLRDYCVKKGYIPADVLAPTNADHSILNMPQFTKEQIAGKRRTFSMYVKFPKKRWDEIRLAEQFTDEGNAKWKELRDEYESGFNSKVD